MFEHWLPISSISLVIWKGEDKKFNRRNSSNSSLHTNRTLIVYSVVHVRM
jgi:hypothetical protein